MACRRMPTRACPAVFSYRCDHRPCARLESDDERPWLPGSRRWRVEACSKEPSETWSQCWWTVSPLDGLNGVGYHDFPTWREAYDYAVSNGAPNSNNGTTRTCPDSPASQVA